MTSSTRSRPEELDDQGLMIFREVGTTEELLEVMKLRYRVLRESRLANLCSVNPYELEFDMYDLRSKHYALIYSDGSGRKIIGCQRGVYAYGKMVSKLAYSLLSETPALCLTLPTSSKLFPCFEYLTTKGAAAVLKFHNQIDQSGNRAVESARFLIDPIHSTAKVATFMAKALVAAYAVSDESQHGITVVTKSHKRFYQRLGFQAVEGTEEMFRSKTGLIGCCLHIHKNLIPPTVLPELEDMAHNLAISGQLVYQPDEEQQAKIDVQRATLAQVAAIVT